MLLRIYLNVVCQVLGWFLTCTWIRWVIWRCFWRVVWWGWGRVIRRNFDILLFRMDTFLFLSVFYWGFASCWFSVIFFSLFIKASISACFFRYSDSSCAFLIRSSFLQASSWRWRSSYLSWVLLISSLWHNISPNPCSASLIMRKAAEDCEYLFFSEWNQRVSLR